MFFVYRIILKSPATGGAESIPREFEDATDPLGWGVKVDGKLQIQDALDEDLYGCFQKIGVGPPNHPF